MTKLLTLLRHAKTERGDTDTADRDRRLTARGEADALDMAHWLEATLPAPDLVLCSTAVRTVQTWNVLAPVLGAARIEMRDDLYLAEADALLEIVRALDDRAENVVLIAHNSGIEDLANELAGEGNPDDMAAMVAKFPTSGAAVLSFETDRWSDAAVGAARLLHFMTPRRLGA